MRIIVGITGASGAILGCRLLETLQNYPDVETHLVMSEHGVKTLECETSMSYSDICKLADYVHGNHNMGAVISSGSFITAGMVIVPCSMKTLSGIANGYDETLMIRAADVCLKENRRVVLVPREMPFSRAHLRNLNTCS